MSSFYACIPAGGSGTRLWPLSRRDAPKFLHRLGSDERSLLQLTMARIEPLVDPAQTFIVCGGAHVAAIARQIPQLPGENFLVEPGPRNSGPAIGLAAAVIEAREPDAIIGSFPADHLISVGDAFRSAVRTAIRVAQTGKLVTLGITPTRPETGYGYIKCGPSLGIDNALEVLSFKEKPAREVAEQYVLSGEYVWNAGMFVCRARDVMDQIRQRAPELADGLMRIAKLWLTDNAAAHDLLGEIWPGLPSISFDHAVMEGAADDGRVATVPCDMGWSDIGDWDTVAEMGIAEGSRLAQPKETLLIDSPGSFATSASGRAVTVIGVPDVVVVETSTAILVARRSDAQRVKEAVEEWTSRGRDDLL
ncbi:mannose-6-phosphate isomerase type 2 [Antricoccus suffuscus]|uniref:Mannose-6-phosphate isomerase type 2 n=1 Tax=Antricoccus suffuscus TaxID=1629062 RepID=A0A2T0ZQH7_9ACTN|nr:mannose-1-phosphate guanylyltransferase [Antricoccus suffuscus]PRZ38606.1 mannose-6-phosphate isomerase type 2 [Antricoccus suffuscus]